MGRNTNGLPFHRHNVERSQMPFLPVYYPKYVFRRKRVQMLPPKKYPYQGIVPMTQHENSTQCFNLEEIQMLPRTPSSKEAQLKNQMRKYNRLWTVQIQRNRYKNKNPYRYFAVGYLPGSTNMLNNVKWPHYALPYQNLNVLLKTTPKTNYYMLNPEQLKINFQSREPYFANPISSKSSLTSNYCLNAYKVGANYAHILPFCIDKVPTLPTPVAGVRSNNTKYIPSTLRLEASTRNPYTQDLFSTSSLMKAINTSHIYFTIGDAITPRALGSSDYKRAKKTNLKNYESFLSTDYHIPRSNAIASEQWTMASNPINLQKKEKSSEPVSDGFAHYFKNVGTQNSTQDFNPYALTDIKATQMHWSLDQFENITCTNSVFGIKIKCVSENKELAEHNVSTEVSTTLKTIKSFPIETTIAFTTASTPPTKVPQLDKISSTMLYRSLTTEPQYLSEKLSSTVSASSSRPTYRRSKLARINRRLVFKEKLKEKDRSSKSSTSSTPTRTTATKTKEKRKYTTSTNPPHAQITPSTRTTSTMQSLLRINNTPKKPKLKFHTKNRSRWSPSNEKTYEVKVNETNTTTSTIISTIFNSTTSAEPQRSTKSSKLRTTGSRHNRRSNSLQISTTSSLPDSRLQSTNPVTSSTPESAIMRISNMGSGKYSVAKNNSSNPVISIPMPSNGFVAELPIVTYFKEMTESIQI